PMGIVQKEIAAGSVVMRGDIALQNTHRRLRRVAQYGFPLLTGPTIEERYITLALPKRGLKLRCRINEPLTLEIIGREQKLRILPIQRHRPGSRNRVMTVRRVDREAEAVIAQGVRGIMHRHDQMGAVVGVDVVIQLDATG